MHSWLTEKQCSTALEELATVLISLTRTFRNCKTPRGSSSPLLFLYQNKNSSFKTKKRLFHTFRFCPTWCCWLMNNCSKKRIHEHKRKIYPVYTDIQFLWASFGTYKTAINEVRILLLEVKTAPQKLLLPITVSVVILHVRASK